MGVAFSLQLAPGSSGLTAGRRWIAGASVRSGLLALWIAASGAGTVPAQTWVAQGPGPTTLGQVENITDRPVVGAINAVTPHPSDANIVYVGAVNGGIWRTANAMATNPNWVRQTDNQQSLSIGALEFDPTVATNQTLIAGMGRFSSFGSGGARTGLLRTTDGGTTWTALQGGGAPVGLNISGVAPRGTTIVVAANTADVPANRGIWRSTNIGVAWTKVSGGAGTGLPNGPSFDLVGDPGNPARLYTNSSAGLFRSTNTGATWAKVSTPAMDALITGADNIKIAMGTSSNVYVAISKGGELVGVFRSGNGGTTWVAMGLPTTAEGGIHPGGQGQIHLSLAADRTNAQVVYIGGDRQDSPFPNSIGGQDFSGRLFRGDASRPIASQWVHLTHSNSQGPAGGGTANGSSPHADSRDMDVAVNGQLIEGDDGGIYRRTNPRDNTGDWFSMNGNIQTTEFHAVAWDAVSNVVIGGAQDTGTPEQQTSSNPRYRSVTTADGGVVAVDDLTSTTQSTRYVSFQNLGSFRRRVYSSTNTFISQVFPARTVISGAPMAPQFYTPIRLHTVTPIRLIFGAGNSVYESLDRGDTVREIGPGIVVNGFGSDPIAYGAAGAPDILYVGSGNRVFVRTAAHPASLTQSTSYPGGTVVGIAINPNNAAIAYVADPTRVFRTANSGGTWTNISENLGTLTPGTLRSLTYSTHNTAGTVVAGSDTGVLRASGPTFTTWSRFGTGIPRVPVYHLEYDSADRVLLAGTLGRGAWTLNLPVTPSEATPAVAEARDEPEAKESEPKKSANEPAKPKAPEAGDQSKAKEAEPKQR